MSLNPLDLLRALATSERITPPSMKWKTVTPSEYRRVYEESIKDPYSFWSRVARGLKWAKPWSIIAEGSPPGVNWFIDGLINPYYNIIGKHRDTFVWSKPAIIWEGEEGDARVLTYSELDILVNRVSSALVNNGVKPGDWVLIYSPPLIEVIATALASVKIGAPFETVFTGFGYYELARRIREVQPRVVFTASGFPRRGKTIDTLSTVRKAVEASGFRGRVVVYERMGLPALRENEEGFMDFIRGEHSVVSDFNARSNHPLFGLHVGYSSDYRLVVHGTGGFLVQVYATSHWIGLRPRDTYYCTVWPGWITGVSYVVFGPLMIGSTIVLYDGGPDYPSWDRWWRIIEDYSVTLFLTTSSALRLLSKRSGDLVSSRRLDTLRAILVTAEPLDPETWWWTYRFAGTSKTPLIDSIPDKLSGRIPVVNLYIQTETGTFITGNLVNYTFPPIAPGSAGTPIPGFDIRVVDSSGLEVVEAIGELVVKNPWPSMPIKYPAEYSEKWSQGYYRTGDYGYISSDGYVYILGRLDNVAKISGYRISPGAIENTLRETLKIDVKIHRVRDNERFEALVLEYRGSINPDEVKSAIRTMIGAISEPREVIKSNA
jgi:acetyl-CoA synthetase